jgi:hypothetical protein
MLALNMLSLTLARVSNNMLNMLLLLILMDTDAFGSYLMTLTG